MFFLRCYEWYHLAIAFGLGAGAMLAFWLALARIAMGDIYREREQQAAGDEHISLGNRDNGDAPDG